MAVNEMHATPQSINAMQANRQDGLRETVVGVWMRKDGAA